MGFSRSSLLSGMLLILMHAQTCLSQDSEGLHQRLLLKNKTLNSNPEATNQDVVVELYSESLCPFCANFIVNHLSHFFDDGLIDIVELRIIPFGNSHINPDGSFTCQHGPDECKLNIIQTCAISLWPNLTQWFPFVLCLESLPRHKAFQQWTSCLKSSSLQLGLIEECYQGPLGDKLERNFAKETNELNPPHRFVPWVLVNKMPLYEDFEFVEKYVCEAYKGPKSLPTACNALSNIFPRSKDARVHYNRVSRNVFDEELVGRE